jgi:serine/threonine protein kinase
VKRYRHRETGEDIAVRQIANSVGSDLFFREAEILHSLRHRSVIEFKGFSLRNRDDGQSSQIMIEWCSEGSLENALQTRPVWFTRLVRAKALFGIAEGMKFIHSREVMHRHLTPENILFDCEHRVRIANFGLSRSENDDALLTHRDCGLLYFAPEIAQDDVDYDRKVDVYSFAIIACEVLFGRSGRAVSKLPEIPLGVYSKLRKILVRGRDANPDLRPSFEEICATFEENSFEVFGLDESDVRPLSDYVAWLRGR